MDDVLQHLEKRLKMLIEEYEELKQTNINLRQNKAKLVREKELLLAKNKIAINQLEAMVSRLRSLEKPI